MSVKSQRKAIKPGKRAGGPSKPRAKKAGAPARTKVSTNYVMPFAHTSLAQKLIDIVHCVPGSERKDRSNRIQDERKMASPEQVAALSVVTNPNQVYRFRLGGYSTISMTSGVADGHFACDPSAAGVNFPEWSSLTALFSEFKLVEFGISVVRNFIGGESKMAATLFATNLGTAINPGSYAALADNPHFMWYNYSNAKPGGSTLVLKANNIGWSQVTTPTIEPYAGAPGSIQYYSNYSSGGTFANYLQVLVWGVYDFTIRV